MKTQARVYTMTQWEAEDTPSIVTGVMDICGLSAKVLIDSRATHSFINSNFAKKLNKIFIPSNT